MADLESFLAQFVEGYLFEDLESMKLATPRGNKRAGAVCYPLLMSTLAGIELLGALLSSSTFDTNDGEKYFCWFWEEYLYPDNAARKSAGRPLYKLVRHGLAHVFATKGPFFVHKSQPSMHLVRAADNSIHIDATQLADDLQDRYWNKVQPIVSQSASMHKRYAELESTYGAQGKTPILQMAVLPIAMVHAAGQSTGSAFPGR